jgi:hypothetical protein
MKTRTTTTPMLAGPAPCDHLQQHPIHGMRLLDGESEAAAAAAAAATAAAAEKAASDKTAADKAAADKVIADAAAAEAARIAASGMSDSEAKLLKENMAAKKKAAAAQEALEAANTRLEAFKGLDPEKIRALVAAQDVAEKAAKAAEEAALIKAGDFDRVKKMMADEHKTALEKVITEANTGKTVLEQALQTINDLTVGSNFNTSAYIGDELVLTPTIARQVYGSNFELENGIVVGYDKARGSKDRTKLVDASGDPLPFDAAIKKLVEASPERDRLVRSGVKPGAGSRTTTTRTTTDTGKGNELRGVARIQAGIAAGNLKKAAK